MDLFGLVLISAFAVYGVLTLAGELAARFLLPELSESLLLVSLGRDTDRALLLWALRQRGQRFLLLGADAELPRSGAEAAQLWQRADFSADEERGSDSVCCVGCDGGGVVSDGSRGDGGRAGSRGRKSRRRR